MRIIPAIDLLGGKCVRLRRGAFDQATAYTTTPLEFARRLEDHGIRYLHLVDLDGARTGAVVNLPVLETLARHTRLQIDFSGGIQTEAQLNRAFAAGAAQVTLGSVAASEPALFQSWLQKYGAEKIILAADCRNRKLVVRGWQTSLDVEVVDFIRKRVGRGLRYVMVTDTDKDGLLAGPSVDLYRDITAVCPVALIASGGVSSVQDLKDLKEVGCEAAIVGKALYEGKISLKEIEALC